MAKRSIIVKNYLKVREEKVAAGTITPGMLLGIDSAGKVVAHATDGGVARMVAIEDELQGKGVDTNYSATAQVSCWVPTPGDQANLLLVAGQNIAIGDLLKSNGEGKVTKWSAATTTEPSSGTITIPNNHVIGVALEALNLSASGAVDALINVQMF